MERRWPLITDPAQEQRAKLLEISIEGRCEGSKRATDLVGDER